MMHGQNSQSPQSIQRVQIQHGSIMRAVKTMYTLFCFRCIWFSVCDPNVICMVQLSSDLRKQYLYRTTAVLCAQCLDLSNLDNPRGTDSHIIGHAFSEPEVWDCLMHAQNRSNRLIPSPRIAMRNYATENEVVS